MLTAFDAIALQKKSKRILPINFNKLPISELHVHAEGGTLDQETLNYLAAKHNRKPPIEIYGSNNTLKFNDGNFLDFLRVYDIAAAYIEDEEDIAEVIYRYLKRCHQQGAIYVELTCSSDHVRKVRKTFAQVQEERALSGQIPIAAAADNNAPSNLVEVNLSYPAIVNAIAKGIDRAKEEFGIEARINMVLLRHNGKAACMATVQEIIAHPHPYVVGINMAGDEFNYPAEDYEECYALAKKHNLKCTAHVGEHADASVMRSALKALKPDRIGHGVTCIQDRALMEFIKKEGIGLEICPTSNVNLRVFPSLAEHPLKQFIDFGIKCALSSDDPTYFGTDLEQEYSRVQKQWDLSFDVMIQLCKNSIEMSFAEPALKHKLMCHVELYEALHRFKNALHAGSAANTKCYQKVEEYIKSPCDYTAREIKTLGLQELPSHISPLDFYQKHENFRAAFSISIEEEREEVRRRFVPGGLL